MRQRTTIAAVLAVLSVAAVVLCVLVILRHEQSPSAGDAQRTTAKKEKPDALLVRENPSHREAKPRQLGAGFGEDSSHGASSLDVSALRPGAIPLRHGFRDIESIAFSPDGRILASSSRERTVRMWDIATGKELIKDNGQGVVFSPDGRLLATGTSKGIIRLWDVGTRKEVLRISGSRMPIAFSPDGRMLIAESDYLGVIQRWDLVNGTETGMLPGPDRARSRAAYSAAGGILAWTYYGDREGTVRTWDVATGAEHMRIDDANDGWPECITFSPDGKILATGGVPPVCLWDVATGEKLVEMQDQAFAIAFSPDGGTLASAGHRGIRLWDVRSGEEKWALRSDVGSLAFSPDGELLASGGERGVIHFWDPKKGVRLSDPDVPTEPAWDVDAEVLAEEESATRTLPGGADVREIPVSEPAWRHEPRWMLRQCVSLDSLTGAFSFENVIQFLQAQTKAKLILDAEVAKKGGPLHLNLGHTKEMSLQRALGWFSHLTGSNYISTDDAILISTTARIAAELGSQIREGKRPNWEADLRRRLKTVVSTGFGSGATVSQVARDMEHLTKIRILVDPKIIETRGDVSVNAARIDFEDTPVADVLSHLLTGAGLTYTLRDGAVFITARSPSPASNMKAKKLPAGR